MRKSIVIVGIIGAVVAILAITSTYAQGPVAGPLVQGGITASGDTINFQGRLYTSAGAPVLAGNYKMELTICSASDCSTAVWGPTQAYVAVDAYGLFNVLLGGSGVGNALTADHFTGDRWLRIRVCNSANQDPCMTGWDTMSPYQRITSVAIAVGNIRKNLPDTSTASSAGYILAITNNSTGGALQGVANGGGYGVYGSSSSTGIYGTGTYGLYGYSGNGGWGVYGIGTSGVWGVEGYSPDSYGVYGVTGGNSYGVYGYSAGASSIGVYGYSAGATGFGVIGENSANIGVYGWSSTNTGVRGHAASDTADVDGVFGSVGSGTIYGAPVGVGTGATGSVTGAGDYGLMGINTSATSAYGLVAAATGTTIYIPPTSGSAGVIASDGSTAVQGYGVYAVSNGIVDTIGNTSAGVYGYGRNSTGNTYGVIGAASLGAWTYLSDRSAGVLGTAGRAGDIGVLGINNGTSGYAYGMFGYATDTTGNGYAYGVYGRSNSPWDGYGVYGYAAAASGTATYGVYGRTDTASNGWAGYFYTGVGKGVYITAPALNVGLQVASGTKSAVVRTADGSRALYTEESAEVWFTDYGIGQLLNGKTSIAIDPIFAQTVNLEEPYMVFLTPRGDCGLYVANQTTTSFSVRALDGKTCSIDFSYRIVAKRLGYEDTRLARAPWADDDPNLYPEKRAEWEQQHKVPGSDAVTLATTNQPLPQDATARVSPAIEHQEPVKPR